MQVRRNPSGGYKVRLPFIARDGYQRQTIELGLGTRNRTLAYRISITILRAFEMLGETNDTRWHLDHKGPFSPQQVADMFMNCNVVHEQGERFRINK